MGGKTGFRINASVLVRSGIIHSTWIGQQLLSKLKGSSEIVAVVCELLAGTSNMFRHRVSKSQDKQGEE